MPVFGLVAWVILFVIGFFAVLGILFFQWMKQKKRNADIIKAKAEYQKLHPEEEAEKKKRDEVYKEEMRKTGTMPKDWNPLQGSRENLSRYEKYENDYVARVTSDESDVSKT